MKETKDTRDCHPNIKNSSRPIYRRVLLKLSGEALQGNKGFGIDRTILNRISKEITKLVKSGVEFAVVVGGGNLFRGSGLEKLGMNRVVGDHMGMLSTIINGLAMQDALNRYYANTKLMSAISLTSVCENYNCVEAKKSLLKKYILILSAGTGNPFFTTDSAACLRGIEINADIVLKATKVDGVFSSDPLENPKAKLYEHLSYQEVLKRNLKIMDTAAFALASEYGLPICVFNINTPGALYRTITGNGEGTLITK